MAERIKLQNVYKLFPVILILASCGVSDEPVFEKKWNNTKINRSTKQRHLDYCQLKASYQEALWAQANPPKNHGQGWQNSGVLLNNLAQRNNDREAHEIYRATKSVCLRDKRFSIETQCVENCEKI